MSVNPILVREKKIRQLDECLLIEIAKLGSLLPPKYADPETIHEILDIHLYIGGRAKYIENCFEDKDDFQEIDDETQSKYLNLLIDYLYNHPDYEYSPGNYVMSDDLPHGKKLPRVWDKYIRKHTDSDDDFSDDEK